MSRGTVSVFLPSLAGGGAERCIAIVASGLAADGVLVNLVLGKAEGPYLADLHPKVRVVDLGVSSTWRALPGLVRHLRAERPQSFLAAMNHANVVAALAHRMARSQARLVLSERAHLSSLVAEFPGWRMRITRALMRLTYPWADQIISVSHGVAEDLRRQLPLDARRVVTIYNPVVDDTLRRKAEHAPTHPWLVTGSAPVVVAAGRLIAQKDFATLLDAFARLRQQRTVRLLILGEGELRGELQARAEVLGVSGDVAMPGFDPNPFPTMRAASLFVLSSRFEGLPGVLIQAMACGTRVVSTDCPSGPREVLEGGRWGALVPVGDAAALADAMAAALDEPQTRDVRERAAAFTDEAAVLAYAQALGLRGA